VLYTAEGTETLSVEVADGVIAAIYTVRNPTRCGT
jgi:hypothetical protein